ncbi:glycosyltransferase family 2 protein [Clostridium perfringens]|uniref:glycosyltransferase family 2 protein n=1 Tax=Clostridium perfringens TaxID=1502 RepID=UPI0013E28F0C|nr:glycosyltransferase [Clostridium perfringens]NGT93728.1 glycosyltransferase family 2 protein [Clostridium perfringens]
MKEIIICICTYNRNFLLENLLKSLNEQKDFNANFKIIIINNFIENAEFKFINKFNMEILLFNEKKKGISYARNRAIEECKKYKFDYLIFLDDDEFVDKYWLKNFLDCAQRYEANIITGPVISIYKKNTPEWIIKSKFFERPIYSTGTLLKTCGAGNVLIKNELVIKKTFKFDEKYALSGGEDTKLFFESTKNGEKIIYCNTAKAYEEIHSKRLNLKYMLKRKFINSITLVNIEKEIFGKKIIIKRLISSFIFIIESLIILPINLFRGRKCIFKNLELLSKGIGQFIGVFKKSRNLY